MKIYIYKRWNGVCTVPSWLSPHARILHPFLPIHFLHVSVRWWLEIISQSWLVSIRCVFNRTVLCGVRMDSLFSRTRAMRTIFVCHSSIRLFSWSVFFFAVLPYRLFFFRWRCAADDTLYAIQWILFIYTFRSSLHQRLYVIFIRVLRCIANDKLSSCTVYWLREIHERMCVGIECVSVFAVNFRMFICLHVRDSAY